MFRKILMCALFLAIAPAAQAQQFHVGPSASKEVYEGAASGFYLIPGPTGTFGRMAPGIVQRLDNTPHYPQASSDDTHRRLQALSEQNRRSREQSRSSDSNSARAHYLNRWSGSSQSVSRSREEYLSRWSR